MRMTLRASPFPAVAFAPYSFDFFFRPYTLSPLPSRFPSRARNPQHPAVLRTGCGGGDGEESPNEKDVYYG